MAMENNIKNAQKLKIILLGDGGVGKTSLINQYVYKKFQNKPILDFQEPLSKELEVNSKHVILQIHDTGGREREGGGLEATFFSDAKGCMLVYDVNNPKSLESLENWHSEFITRVISNRASSRTFPFIVLGNKADTDGGRNKEVHETARKWCESKGITHFPTSAKDNKSVAEAFLHVAQLAINRNTQEPKKETPNISRVSSPPQSAAPPQSPPTTQNGSYPPPTIPSQNNPTNKPPQYNPPPPTSKPPQYNPPSPPYVPPLPTSKPPQYNPPPPTNKPPQYNPPIPPYVPPPPTSKPPITPPPKKSSCCTIL